jgi:DNA-binding CsgD family transcriptional regulator
MPSLFSEISRYTSYLNLHPTLPELYSKLLMDILFSFKIKQMDILSINPTGGLEKVLPNTANLVESHSDQELKRIEQISAIYGKQNIIGEFSEKPYVFTPDGSNCCTPISNGRVEKGLIHSKFAEPIVEDLRENYIIFMGLTSFYLFPKLNTSANLHNSTPHLINPLTPRQRQVVQGFIEGKTNHELSLDLGFSISTIRHETMAIYKTLGASDRKEAAKIAQDLSLI